mmetsp:Transcript_26931/g.50274  ORF Transcript_26931/g.50274 Transcript_26931/m.50274 type:complete len:205 (-) Transcript_26931:83-697(-)
MAETIEGDVPGCKRAERVHSEEMGVLQTTRSAAKAGVTIRKETGVVANSPPSSEHQKKVVERSSRRANIADETTKGADTKSKAGDTKADRMARDTKASRRRSWGEMGDGARVPTSELFKGLAFGLTGKIDRERMLSMIKRAGGRVDNIIHKRIRCVISDNDAYQYRTQRVRKALKHSIPIVSPAWVEACFEMRRLVSPDKYTLQ